MIDVEGEFSQAVCSITPERFTALRAAGVPCVSPPLAGMAEIEAHAGGLFDIIDDGEVAVIVPAGWWDGLNWQIEDLVAFKLDCPGRWWRRLGVAEILGDVPHGPVFPLRLYDTPMGWLRARGAGACIVDWSFDPDRLLYAGPIETETPSLKARLERRIKDAAMAKFSISVSEVRDAA